MIILFKLIYIFVSDLALIWLIIYTQRCILCYLIFDLHIELLTAEILMHYVLLAYLYYFSLHLVSLVISFTFNLLQLTEVETLAFVITEIKYQSKIEKRLIIKTFTLINRLIYYYFHKIFRRE